MGRQKGIINQDRSLSTKKKRIIIPVPDKNAKGAKLPTNTSDISQGEAMKKPKVMRPIITF
jgi:hypothetical protein